VLVAPAAAAFAGIAIGTMNMGCLVSELQVPPRSAARHSYFAFTNSVRALDTSRAAGGDSNIASYQASLQAREQSIELASYQAIKLSRQPAWL
jgi:hypothetical protein